MSKKRHWILLVWSLGAAVLLVGGLESQRIITGLLLRGEAFYNGRPTCYWSAELGNWIGFAPVTGRLAWFPRESFLEKWTGQRFNHGEGPTALMVDPAALPVLTELLGDPSPEIRAMAADAIDLQRTIHGTP